jgi:hypothetical protein
MKPWASFIVLAPNFKTPNGLESNTTLAARFASVGGYLDECTLEVGLGGGFLA